MMLGMMGVPQLTSPGAILRTARELHLWARRFLLVTRVAQNVALAR